MTSIFTAGRVGRFRPEEGFTLIELIMTITVLGILVTISIPNFTSYKAKASFTIIEEQIHFIEQGEELYLVEHNAFFPENARIDIPSGVHRTIPELGLTLPEGHPHRYVIYALNEEEGGVGYSNLYIIVYADIDMDSDGENDVLITTRSYRTTPPTEEVEQQQDEQPQPDPKEKKPKKVGKKKNKKDRR
ncbi:type IV pilin protein [Candidatus Zixiibacteriota bacterium]